MWPWSCWREYSLRLRRHTQHTLTRSYGIYLRENKPPGGAVSVKPISKLNRFLQTSVWRHHDTVLVYTYSQWTELVCIRRCAPLSALSTEFFTSWSFLLAVNTKSVPKPNYDVPKGAEAWCNIALETRLRFILAVSVEPVAKCFKCVRASMSMWSTCPASTGFSRWHRSLCAVQRYFKDQISVRPSEGHGFAQCCVTPSIRRILWNRCRPLVRGSQRSANDL